MCPGDAGSWQPSCAAEALAAFRSGLHYLATADLGALTVGEQADCLRALAAVDSAQVAATARVLGAFDASGGFADDGQMTARSWLRWQTRISPAAAAAAGGWQRRLAAHPDIAAALADGAISPSYARELCGWTDRLPEADRAAADRILLGAAAAGAELADLAALAEEMHRRAAPVDEDEKDRFEQRWVRLTPHWRGHARLDGELAPRAAAAVQAVLDALGKKRGPEDERTAGQRAHDALEEACTRLVAGGLPDRAGQPTQIQLTMTLEQLLGLPGAAAATAAWEHGAAPAPPGSACDASITPIVTGHIDPDVLQQVVPGAGPVDSDHPERGSPGGGSPGGGSPPLVLAGDTAARAQYAAAQLTIADAVRLLSGPPGLTSWLRTSQLSGPAAAASLPLDVGTVTETVPPWLRRAIIKRAAGRCEFPGCGRGWQYCHVHHIVPRSDGGTTSIDNGWLGCDFHHLIVIHRWGWKVVLNADGTTTAVSPDGTKTLHSHAPPTAA
jgi:Domain of unknown function (DUF222)/HNH endonuclease